MANTYDPESNSWICDTTAVVTTTPTNLKSWRWVSAGAAAGDLMKIGNNQNTPLFPILSVSEGTNWNDQQLIEQSWHTGFRVVVPNGTLTVFLY